MNEKYNPREIEPKWQKKWEEEGSHRTTDDPKKPKYYILDMFPYPSGEGLHLGHPKGYTATDIFARTKRMQGYGVLHPMGWDAFGLPAENYALKTKTHPRLSNEKNIANFKRQLKSFGFSYDWEREINTTDPGFYKWTQWTFLKMFEKGLAYESWEPIIWCPSCKTGLAAEDLEGGVCERCGSIVERKPMRQWVLKITDYAERMLEDLDKLPDWENSIKEMQKEWIGKSEGALVDFEIEGKKATVFTTRPDTLFGATYFVLAPEHPLLTELKESITNFSEVEDYIKKAQSKSDLERTDLAKEKTGVEIGGIEAINPVNGKEIPVWVADYVLSGYGTGAIMAVPSHDERDWEFAKKFDLAIVEVLQGGDVKKEAFVGEGWHVNSDFLDGLGKKEGIEKMLTWLEEKGLGKKAINYKLNDWVFSRQRYWGEPIPIIHCEKCGSVAVPEKDLPVTLPEVENYEPTGTGESPLAGISEWVNTTCPKCGGAGKRETNTMPQWAGSSWYYLRFIDPANDLALVDKTKEKYWSPVDFYVGGAEHATRHLIYARFWHKFLFDIGAVSYDEPFTRLQHVGLVLAEDGRKMSKRWGNIINPDDLIASHGADSVRLYEMFMGPFSQACAWNMNGLSGVRRFLEKVWRSAEKTTENASSKKLERLLHKTIKKVGSDIEEFKFNTAISQMMIMANDFESSSEIPKDIFTNYLKVLAPFAPHMAEELWEEMGYKESIFKEAWPEYDPELTKDEEVELVVQINGRVRDRFLVNIDIEEGAAKQLALESEKVKKAIDGKEVRKVIYVKGKLVSIVI